MLSERHLIIRKNNRGFSIVEILSTCPTNWGLTPIESMERLRTECIPYFPLGVYKDITETEDKKMNKEILLAGFGGQGILFAGKVLAYCGLMDKKELSWSPSYGPEMRGGTANCSVCISDEPIASPLVTEPDLMMAMNQPSFEKFINKVKSRR